MAYYQSDIIVYCSVQSGPKIKPLKLMTEIRFFSHRKVSNKYPTTIFSLGIKYSTRKFVTSIILRDLRSSDMGHVR